MSATEHETVPVADPLATFVAVRVNTLRTVGSVAADLFVQYETTSSPLLYCRAGSSPNAQQFAELEEAGVDSLYVRAADFGSFSNGMLDSLEAFLRHESLPATEKFAALQLAFAVAMEQTLRLVDCSKFRNLADQVGNEVVALLANGNVLPRELFRVARHDFSTFSHLTNVAGYCVLLAQRMGTTDESELRRIASAAIMHGLGKRFIPASILAMGSRLTPHGRDLVEAHPQRGYEELREQSDFDFGQLMMVYQHHERVDGTGYPVRLRYDEIHPWAQMLSVVDMFDTMTARRLDGHSATPESALEYQKQLAGTHFDREVVECWVSAMSKT